MKYIGIIGHYAHGNPLSDGQTAKTQTFCHEIQSEFGQDSIIIADTYRWKEHSLMLLYRLMLCFVKCENILLFTARNGVQVFVPLLTVMNVIFRRRTHYVVIGAWLGELIQEKPGLLKYLKQLTSIQVETTSLKTALEKCGLTNVEILPNMKRLSILSQEELIYSVNEPFRVCTFSRIMEEKGIELIINCVKRINEENKRTIYELDLYGMVDDGYAQRFDQLCNGFPEAIRYKGVIKYSESVATLRSYYLLAFPTMYKTEGIPGTIIDAYFAGVPVIASKWNSYTDIIVENSTGLCFELGNEEDLYNQLKYAYEHRDIINLMKENCLKKANEYSPAGVMTLVKKMFKE